MEHISGKYICKKFQVQGNLLWKKLVLLVPWNGAFNLRRASVLVSQVYLLNPDCNWGLTFSNGVKSLNLALLPMPYLVLCQGVLSKATVANHLKLLKQVKYVFDNGDLESKELALVLFGCWADFANDNAQMRYLILSSLVSPHDCEVRASLFAAGCFCETSDDFACITVEMLFNMMNSSKVSLPVKMAAAQVFTKFKCPFSVANKAYKAGLQLVLNSPDEDVLVAMLFSLSELSSAFSLLASNQVDFLLSFISRERSSRVQETALRCLRFLSEKGQCQYPAEHLSPIEKLCHQTSIFN